MKKLFPLALMLAPVLAYSYCFAPSVNPPHEPWPTSKPSKPSCLPSCSEWEIDRYQREMNTYIEELKRYADEAQEAADEYMDEVSEYVRCELNGS